MQTLHLIDADSTQACPAVLASIRATITDAQAEKDTLLLIGGRPLHDAAQDAGIEYPEQLTAPFGKATLGLSMLHKWAKRRTAFDHVHCWSHGAVFAAARVFKHTPLQLLLAHTPKPTTLKRLRRLKHSDRGNDLTVVADNPVLADRLASAGTRCRTTPLPLTDTQNSTTPSENRAETRKRWKAQHPGHLTIALLSDHPDLADAAHAALVIALAGASLKNNSGRAVSISLITHPTQLNRRRAETLFRGQDVPMRVTQDHHLGLPWSVLNACDAALAIGPDAGGLSLRYALNLGTPVIAPTQSPAGQIDDPPANLHLAPSSQPKDLAHRLHEVLADR